MPRFRRNPNTAAHAKLHALIAERGSLKAISVASGVAYPRLLQIMGGVEPRASEAAALAVLGVPVSDWS